jgi:hypothetical protein
MQPSAGLVEARRMIAGKLLMIIVLPMPLSPTSSRFGIRARSGNDISVSSFANAASARR